MLSTLESAGWSALTVCSQYCTNAPTLIARGSWASATQRSTMSRSESMPMKSSPAPLTGIEVTPRARIRLAASTTLSDSLRQGWAGVIRCRASIVITIPRSSEWTGLDAWSVPTARRDDTSPGKVFACQGEVPQYAEPRVPNDHQHRLRSCPFCSPAEHDRVGLQLPRPGHCTVDAFFSHRRHQ